MLHTLLTFTPPQDAREDIATRELLPCVPLTQTFGPIPLASIDSNGWAIWEQKLVLLEGHLIQIAPVVGGQVLPPTNCFDVQGSQQAIKLTISKDPQNPSLFSLKLEPAGGAPANPLNNSIRLSNSAAQNQPTPTLQIITVRDQYMSSSQTLSMDFIGTIDTRPGRSAKIVFGNTVTIWAEQDAVHAEWSAL